MSSPAAVWASPGQPRNDRLRRLIVSGLIDSFGLALGWTVFNLHAVAAHGLAAVGLFNAAMLTGVALSAPAAGWIAARADGGRLLKTTALVEAVLRVATFLALLNGAPLAVIAGGIVVMYVISWTAYAGMRAEVSATDRRAAAMTWYAVCILSIEAVGSAAAAVLPADPDGTLAPALLWGVMLVYAGSLVPQYRIGRDARVLRAPRVRLRALSRRHWAPLGSAAGVMLLASGPTLLVVGLAAELHGRVSVAAAGIAFTLGALIAPAIATWIERHRWRPQLSWPLLGMMMVLGWVMAPRHLAGLLAAQLFSGVALAAFEGITDTHMTARADGHNGATAALAWSAAARAFGSAAAVGAAPAIIGLVGVGPLSIAAAGVLAAGAVVLALLRLVAGRGAHTANPALAGDDQDAHVPTTVR